jgi:hypothetical protein
VVAAVLLAVLVKTFLVQVFFIPSGSMERTQQGCPGCNGDGSPGVLVPPGRLWVTGDHRAASGDSRDKGTIPADHVVGRAVGVVWPLPRVQPLRVPSTLR